MDFTSPIVGGLAGIASGLIGAHGQKRANEQTLQSAREAMAFTERMSNTSYQRAMADMRAAGLNPMLAFMKGGASTPGGSQANMQNELGTVANSAAEMARLSADYKQILANTELSKAMTAKTLAEAKKLGFDTSKSQFWSGIYSPATDFVRDVKSLSDTIQNRLPEGRGPVNKRTGKKERTLEQRVNAHYSLTSGRK